MRTVLKMEGKGKESERKGYEKGRKIERKRNDLKGREKKRREVREKLI